RESGRNHSARACEPQIGSGAAADIKRAEGSRWPGPHLSVEARTTLIAPLIQNNSNLPQGLADSFAAGWRCGKPPTGPVGSADSASGRKSPMLDTQRREFIALLGAGGLLLAVKVRRARAPQPRPPIIGYLHGGSAEPRALMTTAFREGLAEAGYVEGQNVAIEFRWAEGRADRLPAMAAELVRRQVAVLVAAGGDAAPKAAKAAT